MNVWGGGSSNPFGVALQAGAFEFRNAIRSNCFRALKAESHFDVTSDEPGSVLSKVDTFSWSTSTHHSLRLCALRTSKYDIK